MKRLLTFCLICTILFTITGCNKNKENDVIVETKTDKFNLVVDDVVDTIEDNENLSEVKEDVKEIKEEIQEIVTKATDEEKSQYDVKQIAVFMLEKAIEDYEIAQKNEDAEKMNEAKTNIELAKNIWSSSNNK